MLQRCLRSISSIGFRSLPKFYSMALDTKPSLNAFLKHSKADITTKDRITIVIGNESCDLDSATSAILYAWLRSGNPPSSAFSQRYVPLLNIPREDIKLRPEFQALFHECGVSPDSLTTLSDLPSADLLPPDQTQWILVDHNKLEGDLGKVYSHRVIGCIDHHEEENAVPQDTAPEPRIVEKSGSCTSLVLRELAKGLSGSQSSHDNLFYPPAILKLGLASIMVDTHNLKDMHKTQDVDIAVARQLNEKLGKLDSTWNSDIFYKQINGAKTDLRGLSVEDILRKDYKQWTESRIKLGTSSFVRQLDFLYDLSEQASRGEERQAWRSIVKKFMENRKLDIWAIMNAFTTVDESGNERFNRQLEIHWLDGTEVALVKKFEERYHKELQLTTNNAAPKHELAISWNQGNLAASRKQIAPMLRTVMKEYAKI